MRHHKKPQAQPPHTRSTFWSIWQTQRITVQTEWTYYFKSPTLSLIQPFENTPWFVFVFVYFIAPVGRFLSYVWPILQAVPQGNLSGALGDRSAAPGNSCQDTAGSWRV